MKDKSIIKCRISDCDCNNGIGECESVDKLNEYKDSVYVDITTCKYFNTTEERRRMEYWEAISEYLESQ